MRFVYNWGLAFQKKALERKEKLPSTSELCRGLALLKKTQEHTWLKNVSSVPLQQALRDLGRGWSNFFAKNAKPPRFKRKFGKQSARYNTNAFTLKEGTLKLAKMSAPLDIRWSRELPGQPSSCTVTCDRLGRYHISFVVEVEPALEYTGHAQVGIDLGLKHFATLPNGTKIENPAFLKKDLAALERVQQSLARKKKGSRNRYKARLRVARLHARIADERRDFLHKLSTQLVAENQALAVESLDVCGMVRHRRLSRAISDASWGSFVRMLTYKCEWYGRDLRAVDRFYPSSKTCSCCGHVLDTLALDVRRWQCSSCGRDHDRDINAARNIAKAAGLAVRNVCGEVTPEQGEQLQLFTLLESSHCTA